MKMINETRQSNTQYSAVGASAKQPLPNSSRTDASVVPHALSHAEAGTRCRAADDLDANANDAAVANAANATSVTVGPPPSFK